MAEKTTDFSTIRIKPPTTDKFRQRVAGLCLPQTEFAPPPHCLIRLFIIQGGWNRAPPIQLKRAQNRLLLGGVSAPLSPMGLGKRYGHVP